MEDVILLVILVSVLYLLLCLLIAFIRALFPGKRSRKSCFILDVFPGDPESPQLALTDAGQKVALFLKRTISRKRITAKNRPGHLTGAVWLPYSAS